MDRITSEGTSKMMNSAIFGQVIILIVFIPVLSLSGVEGKMFRPMALSFSFAVLGAMFFGLTWLPVASSLFLRPEKGKKFGLTRYIMRLFYRSYDPVIKWSYDHKWVIFSLALASLVITGVVFSRMGGEFVPTLDEGDFVIQPVLRTGTSLSKTVDLTTRMENILMEEFVISANKSPEKKVETPFMISALEPEQLRTTGFQTGADILMATGNVMVQKSQGYISELEKKLDADLKKIEEKIKKIKL